MAAQREKLLTKVECTDPTQGLNELYTRHLRPDDTFSLAEFISDLSKKDVARLYSACLVHLTKALESADLQDSRNLSDENADVLDAVICCCATFLSENIADVPEPFVQTLSVLHDHIILLVQAKEHKIANEVTKLCESYYYQDRILCDNFIAQTMIFLLLKSLEPEAKHSDIMRVYKFREVLPLFECDDDEDIMGILLRTIISPEYLSCPEGRKFVSYIFRLRLSFVDHIYATMKNFAADASPFALEAYGEILCRAWRDAIGPFVLKIETSCIQDLMHCAVHTAPATATKVRGILNVLHEAAKKETRVEEMVNRLYEPILWRALRVANPHVRKNAAHIFIEAFPLRNPEAPSSDYESALIRQLQCMQELLDDITVAVRVVAVQGVGRILGNFWEIIPQHHAKVLMHRLLELSRDSSGAPVRTAVYRTIKYLLDNPLIHPSMKSFMTKLGHPLHDRSESVRTAFVDLLLYVKNIRSIRFYDVASIDSLLHTLKADTLSIRKKVVELLLPTYFPYSRPGDLVLSRCLAMVVRDADAAKAFFSLVYKSSSTAAVAKLISLLLDSLSCAVENRADPPSPAPTRGRKGKRKAEKKPASPEASQEDHQEDGEDGLSEFAGASFVLDSQNQAQVVAVFEVICALWGSIRKSLEKSSNRKIRDALADRANEDILLYMLQHFPYAQQHIMTFATCLPGTSCRKITQMLQDTLFHLEAGDAETTMVVNGLCGWGHMNTVLGFIRDNLNRSICKPAGQESRKRKGGSASHHLTADGEMDENSGPAMVALGVLETILQNENSRPVLLRRHKDCDQLFEMLSGLYSAIENRIESAFDTTNISNEVLIKAFITSMRLAFHMASEERDAPLKAMWSWLQGPLMQRVTVLAGLAQVDGLAPDGQSPPRQRLRGASDSGEDSAMDTGVHFVSGLVQVLYIAVIEGVSTGLIDTEQSIQFVDNLLHNMASIKPDDMDDMMLHLWKFAYQVFERVRASEEDESSERLNNSGMVLLSSLLSHCEDLSPEVQGGVVSPAMNLIASLQSQAGTLSDFASSWFPSTLNNVGFGEDPSESKMNSVACTLLLTVLKHKAGAAEWKNLIVAELENDDRTPHSVYACLKLLETMKDKGVSIEDDVKRAASTAKDTWQSYVEGLAGAESVPAAKAHQQCVNRMIKNVTATSA